MRPTRSTTLASAFVAALGVTSGCGKSKGSHADGAVAVTGAAGSSVTNLHVTVSGTAAPLPLNAALGADDDFSQLKVAMVEPSAIIIDPSARPLGSMTLDTTPGNCAPPGCKWALPGIDLSKPTLDRLLATVEDTRSSGARLWATTATGVTTKAELEAVR